VAPKKILLEEKEKGRCFMKKLMLILVALVVAPAMAAVTFDYVVDCDAGTVTITYTTDGEQPRGLALNLASDDGVSMDSLVSWGCFNVCLDYAFDNSEGYTVGMTEQTPIADPTAAGVGTLPATEISVCMGYLDENGIDPKGEAGPDACTDVITLAISGTGTIVVSADTLRGPDSGVVGSELASNLPITIPVDCAGDPCLTILSQPGYELQLARYNEYVGGGYDVSCWCNAYQCDGDAANDVYFLGYRVYTTDLTKLANSWKAKLGDANLDPCADVAHDTYFLGYRVYTTDLSKLATNWKLKDADLPGNCPRPDGM
jgi:hypothetical protein